MAKKKKSRAKPAKKRQAAKSPRRTRGARVRPLPIRQPWELERLSELEIHARERALEVLSNMRRFGWSLTHAARQALIDRDTVKRYAGTALRTDASGRYRPTGKDRLLRQMNVLTTTGRKVLDVQDSATASFVGEYMNGVREFLKHGNWRVLRPFRRPITVGRIRYYLEIDAVALRQYADAQELSYELYPHQ